MPCRYVVDRDVEVVIDSPDTYVFLLMIEMHQRLPVAASFLTGYGKLKITIAEQPISDVLGPKRASATLGFRAYTGSDMCGRLAGRTKEWCFKVLISCDDEIEALTPIGNIDPSPETRAQLERFVYSFINSTYCSGTLLSNDSEKGWRRSPMPSSSS